MLDRICDSPMHDAANVAAELLDEFFDDGGHNDMGSSGNVWIDSAAPTFGVSTNDDATNGLGGRGRGRGATMPSWMTK